MFLVFPLLVLDDVLLDVFALQLFDLKASLPGISRATPTLKLILFIKIKKINFF
jgi:hypothetical protein